MNRYQSEIDEHRAARRAAPRSGIQVFEISMFDAHSYSLWRPGVHSRPHTARGGRPRKRRSGAQREAQHEVSAGGATLRGHYSRTVLRALALGHVSCHLQRHRYAPGKIGVYAITEQPSKFNLISSNELQRKAEREMDSSDREYTFTPNWICTRWSNFRASLQQEMYFGRVLIRAICSLATSTLRPGGRREFITSVE